MNSSIRRLSTLLNAIFDGESSSRQGDGVSLVLVTVKQREVPFGAMAEQHNERNTSQAMR